MTLLDLLRAVLFVAATVKTFDKVFGTDKRRTRGESHTAR